MNRKSSLPSIIIFLFVCTIVISCTIKSMKRFQEDPIGIRDNKRQKLTEDLSENEEPFLFEKLPVEIQEKIIAISPNKNSIRVTSKGLKETTSNKNINIYRHNPLHLTPNMQAFGSYYAVDKNHPEIIKNLADQQYLSHHNDRQKSFMVTLATQNKNREILAQLQSLFPNQKVFPVINRIAIATYHDDLNELAKLIKFVPVGDAQHMDYLQAMDVLPAFIATGKGYLDILQFLKKNKPELLEEITEEGYSLLHIAASQNSTPDVLEYLLDNTELDINKESELPKKVTPLHLAVVYKRPEAVSLLIERGAIIDPICAMKINNIFRRVTPAGLAILYDSAKALEVLLSYYKNENISLLPFMSKDNALKYATSKGYQGIVELLKSKDL